MQGNPLANRGKIGYDENINPDGTGGREALSALPSEHRGIPA